MARVRSFTGTKRFRAYLPPIIVAFAFVAAVQGPPSFAQGAHSGNYAFSTSQGDLVIPLPEGSWLKALEHETHETIDLGTVTEAWQKLNVFLAKAGPGGLEGVVTINTNASDILGDELAPPDYCYSKQTAWKFHKQISALAADTYCWGVRTVTLPIGDASESEAWRLFSEKSAKSGWPLGLDAPATQVRFLRWVNGRFVRIDYYFLAPEGGEPMPWPKARDWARALEARVKRGYEGEAK